MGPEIEKTATYVARPALHRLRLATQAAFALFCLYSGIRFYQFYQWALGNSATYFARPPSVEGFLPISALVSLKRLVLSGVYDRIHPAGLTIFLAALVIGLLLRKGFCGWICPVGFVSQLAERVGRRFRLLWRPPEWLDYPLLALKYLLLGFFAYLILLKMDLQAIEAFNRSPYNLVVDARMLTFFLAPTATTVWVMSGLVVASFFLRNFWCRYLCPYGALLGLLAWCGPARIKRDRQTCINCRKCEKVCPGAIRVAGKNVVHSPECQGCLECVATCPVPDCLTVSLYGRRRLPPLLIPLGVVGIFLLAWGVAVLTGHWHTDIPLDLLQRYYRMAASLTHP